MHYIKDLQPCKNQVKWIGGFLLNMSQKQYTN